MDENKAADDDSSKEKEVDEFPLGMRVLAVDDDSVCLKVLEGYLVECGYKVTVTQHALTAIQLLRESKDNYDIVISDVRMPDMDGFKLLEIVGLEMDLPVIMLSVDGAVSTVMKGIMHGACDYLLKPVRVEELKLIWKHVIRKSLHETKEANNNADKLDHLAKSEEDNSSKLARKGKDQKREKEDDDSSDEDYGTQKRPRVAWTPDLHNKFINAVNQLGLDRAVPKRILDLMDVPGLTRENVASHLQKYRKALKKNSMEAAQQYHGGDGSNGFGANNPRSVILPFHNRGPNISSLDGFRVEGYANYGRPNYYLNVHQSHSGNTHETSLWMPLSLNNQNGLHPQYVQTTQAGELRPQPYAYVSNPSIMETISPQAVFNQGSYPSLTPRLNQPSGYNGGSSQSQWAGDANFGALSTPQPGYAPNSQNFNTLLNNTNSQHTVLKDNITASHQQHNLNASTEADSELGTQTNRDLLSQLSEERTESKEKSSPELETNPQEPSSSETIFHLNKCDSADDLHAVIKQFQQ